MTDFVYLIHDDFSKAYKIGVSSNPIARLANLQTASARGNLKLVATIKGSYSLEEHLHSTFSKYRLNGEWFEDHKDILKFFGNPEPYVDVHKDFKVDQKTKCKNITKIAVFFMENPKLLEGFESNCDSNGNNIYISFKGKFDQQTLYGIYDYLSLKIADSLSLFEISYKDLTHCIFTGLNFIEYSTSNKI